MSVRTIALLVDADGVIAPYDLPGAERLPWPTESWRTAPVLFGMKITWSGAMVERLAQIAVHPGVEPAWCSTWRLLAVSPRPELGLEPHHLDQIDQFIAAVSGTERPRE